MAAPVNTPLFFEPILKPRAWGGDALRSLGKPLPPGTTPSTPIGESWELADLPPEIPAGCSVVASGPHAGRTLRSLIESNPREVMGAAPLWPDGRFPLLLKYLDARENLSVQVHPTAAYAEAHPPARIKSEAWYIIHADPGAVIYAGLLPGVTRQDVERAIAERTLPELMYKIPAVPGDCHYLPSGLCHALGAGIFAAEVQTPSDTTFRLFDWERTDRELHIEAALACLFGTQTDTKADTAPTLPPTRPPGLPPTLPPGQVEPVEAARTVTTGLCRTEFFEIERIDADPQASFEAVTNNAPLIWMVLDGSIRFTPPGGEAMTARSGQTVLLPAGMTDIPLGFVAATRYLQISLPAAHGTLLA